MPSPIRTSSRYVEPVYSPGDVQSPMQQAATAPEPEPVYVDRIQEQIDSYRGRGYQIFRRENISANEARILVMPPGGNVGVDEQWIYVHSSPEVNPPWVLAPTTFAPRAPSQGLTEGSMNQYYFMNQRLAAPPSTKIISKTQRIDLVGLREPYEKRLKLGQVGMETVQSYGPSFPKKSPKVNFVFETVRQQGVMRGQDIISAGEKFYDFAEFTRIESLKKIDYLKSRADVLYERISPTNTPIYGSKEAKTSAKGKFFIGPEASAFGMEQVKQLEGEYYQAAEVDLPKAISRNERFAQEVGKISADTESEFDLQIKKLETQYPGLTIKKTPTSKEGEFNIEIVDPTLIPKLNYANKLADQLNEYYTPEDIFDYGSNTQRGLSVAKGFVSAGIGTTLEVASFPFAPVSTTKGFFGPFVPKDFSFAKAAGPDRINYQQKALAGGAMAVPLLAGFKEKPKIIVPELIGQAMFFASGERLFGKAKVTEISAREEFKYRTKDYAEMGGKFDVRVKRPFGEIKDIQGSLKVKKFFSPVKKIEVGGKDIRGLEIGSLQPTAPVKFTLGSGYTFNRVLSKAQQVAAKQLISSPGDVPLIAFKGQIQFGGYRTSTFQLKPFQQTDVFVNERNLRLRETQRLSFGLEESLNKRATIKGPLTQEIKLELTTAGMKTGLDFRPMPPLQTKPFYVEKGFISEGGVSFFGKSTGKVSRGIKTFSNELISSVLDEFNLKTAKGEPYLGKFTKSEDIYGNLAYDTSKQAGRSKLKLGGKYPREEVKSTFVGTSAKIEGKRIIQFRPTEFFKSVVARNRELPQYSLNIFNKETGELARIRTEIKSPGKPNLRKLYTNIGENETSMLVTSKVTPIEPLFKTEKQITAKYSNQIPGRAKVIIEPISIKPKEITPSTPFKDGEFGTLTFKKKPKNRVDLSNLGDLAKIEGNYPPTPKKSFFSLGKKGSFQLPGTESVYFENRGELNLGMIKTLNPYQKNVISVPTTIPGGALSAGIKTEFGTGRTIVTGRDLSILTPRAKNIFKTTEIPILKSKARFYEPQQEKIQTRQEYKEETRNLQNDRLINRTLPLERQQEKLQEKLKEAIKTKLTQKVVVRPVTPIDMIIKVPPRIIPPFPMFPEKDYKKSRPRRGFKMPKQLFSYAPTLQAVTLNISSPYKNASKLFNAKFTGLEQRPAAFFGKKKKKIKWVY